MKYLYVLFSATPYKTGAFIRNVLHNRYNHVALSFNENLSDMYSFSRRHANAPFYGGFVKESFARYEWQGHFSDIKVCRLKISDKQYAMIKTHIERMHSHKEAYVYNYYSAAMTPLSHRISIRNAYTCVEFVGDILSMTNLRVKYGNFHSLQKLERLCAPYVIYEGSARRYPGSYTWSGDTFKKKMPISEGLTETAKSFGRLTGRGIEDAYGYVCDKFGFAVES